MDTRQSTILQKMNHRLIDSSCEALAAPSPTVRRLGLTLMAALLCGAMAWAQRELPPRYTATLATDSVRLDRGQVQVDFRLDLGGERVRSQHTYVLTPVIDADSGRHRISLPSVLVKGRKRAIQDSKRPASVRQAEADTAYCVLRSADVAEGQSAAVDYSARVPYEPWMEQARLHIEHQVVGCACGELLRSRQVAMDPLLYQPRLEVSPQAEVPREFVPRTEQRDAFLIYPVNQTRLYADRYGNRGELQKIDSALQLVQRNPAYEIRRIDITGFASPEGRYAHNVRLAEGRADALRQYVLREHPQVADSLMHVSPGAENWLGLAQAVASLDLPYKDEIQALVADTLLQPDEREARLRRVGGGQPYAMLLRAVYPGLRKNTFRIGYISRERTPEEARTLVFTEPGELNVYEFFTVARLFYADDPEGYARVVRAAADAYPDHALANHNAASLCLAAGLLDEAQVYLDRTLSDARTWNNRGILCWKRHEADEAVAWWQKAADAGDLQARHNLDEVRRRGF